MRKVLIPVILLLLCLICASSAAGSDLTLMIYMAGSDLETQAGAAGADLEEIAAALPDKGLQVTVLTGGSSEWKNGIPADQNILWQVTREGLSLLESYDAANMGEASVLSAFLKESAERCPADHYALILWDHGGGPLMGVCFDERFGFDGLTLGELDQALRNSPFADHPLMFIGFDACLMGTLEVADAVRPYAEYMIASQEPEPAAGWDYRFISAIAQADSGLEAGKQMIDAFAASQQEAVSASTLSCICLEETEKLDSALSRIFGALAEQINEETYSSFAACRYNAKCLGASSPTEWDLVDLMDLADLLEEKKLADCTALRDALKDAVVYQYANEDYVHGLSIYAPFSNKEKFTKSWGSRYLSQGASQGYLDYTKAFADQWLEKGRSFWRDGKLIEAEKDLNRELLSVQLTEEEAGDIAGARLLILEQYRYSGTEEYRLLNTVENLLPEDQVLSASYHQEALYLVTEDEAVDGPLTWRPLDGITSSLGLDQVSNGIATFCLVESPERELYNMYLTWIRDPEGFYQPGPCYVLNEDLDTFFVSKRGLQPGDTVRIGGYMRRYPDRDAFYADWDSGDIIMYCEQVYTEDSNWKLAFLPLQSSADRVALFEITDFHGNAHLSDPIPLPNTSSLSLLDDSPSVCREDLTLSLESAVLNTGADVGLELDLKLTNNSGKPVSLLLEGIALNQAFFTQPRFWWGSQESFSDLTLKPGGTQTLHVELNSGDLSDIGERQLHTARICLAQTRKTSRVTKLLWFDFDLPVNLGLVLPADDSGKDTPLAVMEQHGVRVTVSRIEYDPRCYCYVADVYFENLTEEDLWAENLSIRINGSSWIDVGLGDFLPAYCHLRQAEMLLDYFSVEGKSKTGFPVNDSSEIETLDISMDLVKPSVLIEETFYPNR